MLSKESLQSYLGSESPECLVGGHPTVAGADLRVRKHRFDYRGARPVTGNVALEQVIVGSPGDSSGRSRNVHRSHPYLAGLEDKEVCYVVLIQI